MEVKIRKVKGTILYDSRGRPTIEVRIITERGSMGKYASPSGASIGSLEVVPLPRGGMHEAIKILEDELSKKLAGFTYSNQEEFDEYIQSLDGTGKYERIGGIISLGLSFAAAEAASKDLNIPLYRWFSRENKIKMPIPLGNIVGGGKHAMGRSIDIQEVLAFPLNATSYREAVVSLFALHRKVGEILSDKDSFFTAGRNDEGAWVTSLPDDDVFPIIWEAIDIVRKDTGVKFGLGVDIAASSIWDNQSKLYVYRKNNVYRDREEQIEYVIELVKKYNLTYVEDPLHENDFPGFSVITRRVGRSVLIVGDDLYVTNASRIILGIGEKAGNSVIIKPNQVGDISKAIKAVNTAKKGGFKVIVSHRSGETTYPHLSHFAVATNSDLYKVGVMYGERIIKHNEMILIEDDLGSPGMVRLW